MKRIGLFVLLALAALTSCAASPRLLDVTAPTTVLVNGCGTTVTTAAPAESLWTVVVYAGPETRRDSLRSYPGRVSTFNLPRTPGSYVATCIVRNSDGDGCQTQVVFTILGPLAPPPSTVR